MGFGVGGSGQHEPLPSYLSPPIAPDAGSADAASLAQMVERIVHRRVNSGAEALKELRAAFPDSPLALRVAALNVLMRRRRGEAGNPWGRSA